MRRRGRRSPSEHPGGSPSLPPVIHVRIPRGLDFVSLARVQVPPSPFDPEVAALLLDTIICRQNRKRPGAFIPLKAEYLERLHWRYNQYLDWLRDAGVIERDGFYVPGSKSFGYRLSTGFREVGTRRFAITGKKAIRSYMRRNAEGKKSINRRRMVDPVAEVFDPVMDFPFSSRILLYPPPLPRSLLRSIYISWFMYDPESAEKKLREIGPNFSWVFEALKATLMRVQVDEGWKNFIREQVKTGKWSTSKAERAEGRVERLVDGLRQGRAVFKRDRVAGRLHTNLSGIDTPLRPFIRIEGVGRLCHLDIRSCQPYLMLRFGRDAGIGEEVLQQWARAVCENDLYGMLALEAGTSRGEAKKAWCMVAFGHDRIQSPVKDALIREFPEMAELIRVAKIKDPKALSHRLQQYEAHAMLERIVPRLVGEDIPVLTIHDSLIVPEEVADRVQTIMIRELTAFTGFPPMIHRTAL
jgi:hypothetical protein